MVFAGGEGDGENGVYTGESAPDGIRRDAPLPLGADMVPLSYSRELLTDTSLPRPRVVGTVSSGLLCSS
jgi:hypothetical protein